MRNSPPSPRTGRGGPDVCFEGEVFEELWIATGGLGPAGFASAEFRKLSRADLYTISERLKREARIDTGGMWLGTWLKDRHWEHEPLGSFSEEAMRTGEGFSAFAARKAREYAAGRAHSGEGFSARAVRKARERAARSGETFSGYALREARELAAEEFWGDPDTNGGARRLDKDRRAEIARQEQEQASTQARRRRDIDEWKERIAAGGYKSGRNWCDDPTIYDEARRELEAEKSSE